MQELLEPESWIARWIINCLRQWQIDCKPAPLMLGVEDIDYLAREAEGLRVAWTETKDSLDRCGIPLVQRPVMIDGEFHPAGRMVLVPATLTTPEHFEWRTSS